MLRIIRTEKQPIRPLRPWALVLSLLAILLSIAFNLYQYWPGWIDGDGSAMVWEAHYGWFESYLPVVMTAIIRLIFILSTPSLFPVLIFQLCLACIVLGVVLRWQGLHWPNVLVIAGFLMLLPPVSSYSGTIVKDVWFAWMAILASGALVQAARHQAWYYWLAWVASASLAVSFRMDGFGWFFTAALCIGIYLVRRRDSWGIARLVISSGVIFLLYILLPVLIGRWVPIEKRYPVQQILLFDLAAISLEAGELLIPEMFNPNRHGMEFLEQHFHPGSNMSILNWGQKPDGFSLVHEREANDALKRAWFRAVKAHPNAYLDHRWQVAQRFLLGRPEPTGWFWFRYRTSPNVFGEQAARVTPTREFWQRKILDRAEGSLINQLWPYLLILALGALPGMTGTDGSRLFTRILFAGSAAYAVCFALIAPNVGYRYYYFPVAASLLTASLVLVHLARKYSRRQMQGGGPTPCPGPADD